MPSTISVAMVVNNDARHLRECLESIKGLADEICIVDTGSTDETLSVAREYNAKISVFIWCDDAAAIRNEAIRLCKKDWIFMIDADERIDPNRISEIRALTNGPRDRCYSLPIRTYTNTNTVSGFIPCDEDDPHGRGFTGWFPAERIRLWPSNAGAKFEGKVEEAIAPVLERQGLKLLSCDVPVHHYPHIHENSDKDTNGTLSAAPSINGASTNGERSYKEIGNEYAQTGNYPEAAKAYFAALKQDKSDPITLINLAAVLHKLGRDDEAKHALHVALELNPEQYEGWRDLGIIYLDGHEWQASLECFEKAQKLDPQWKEGPRFISMALEGLERFEEAVENAQRAFETMPNSQETLRLFIHQMLRLGKRAEARDIILNAIEKGAQNPNLHNALGELFFYDKRYNEAKEHFRKAGELGLPGAFNNLGVVHFQFHQLDEARQAFEKCLEADPAHKGAQRNLEKVLKATGES